MATYEIIVTDVTCYGDLYCVAGWDRLSNLMIRPEPPGANAKIESSRFWNDQFAGPGKVFSVGNLVRFIASPALPDFLFPHATEDRVVDLSTQIEILDNLNLPKVAEEVTGSVSSSLEVAFDGALIRPASQKAYVLVGEKVRSLGALELAPSQIIFFENRYDAAKPKLRARVTVGGNTFDLSVPADAARNRWKSDGLAGLRADLRASRRIHVRTGLSRPFSAKPNDCYSQINGVYFL
jgi:hypothetical protein